MAGIRSKAALAGIAVGAIGLAGGFVPAGATLPTSARSARIVTEQFVGGHVVRLTATAQETPELPGKSTMNFACQATPVWVGEESIYDNYWVECWLRKRGTTAVYHGIPFYGQTAASVGTWTTLDSNYAYDICMDVDDRWTYDFIGDEVCAPLK